jgi:hypothetical protein
MLGIQAMVHVVMDQRALGVHHGLLHGLQSAPRSQAGLARLDHLDHRAQMPVGAFQPGDQGGVGCMQVRFDIDTGYPPGGIEQDGTAMCVPRAVSGRLS